MASIENIELRPVSGVKDGAKAYIGESTGAYIPGIGDVIIIADDRDTVAQAFEKLCPDKPYAKDIMRTVALLPREKIEA